MVAETKASSSETQELKFVHQVQTYLGGKGPISRDPNKFQVEESINRIIGYVENKAPLDCIYDDGPLGFEKPDQQSKTVEIEDPLEEINLGDDQNPRITYVSNLLKKSFKERLSKLLKEYKDCFAWDYDEMPGLSRSIVEHRLPLVQNAKAVKQPSRRFALDIILKIKEEIERLLKAKFIRTARYVHWISNIVPVMKKNGKLRVCIDFRDLNNATPKDEYPMPIADMMVDSAAGNEILSFMDGYSGYNQIFIAEEDISKTAFRCPGAIGTYEWVMMPFGLKNAGATYQRAMNLIFHDLIGKSMQVYIDDVVVKSMSDDEHLENLRVAFEKMRAFGLKMNPLKCGFGVSTGKFLGFLVKKNGIEVDKNKAQAIFDTRPPRNKKELQSLLGKINFLRRFISNLSGKVRVFSPLLRLKKEEEFKWGHEHQQAFDQIKIYLSNPPILTPPRPGFPLKLYISASDDTIGSMLCQEFEDGVERAIYYLSRILNDAETRYSYIEKLCLSLYFSCTKLKYYMKPFEIQVISQYNVIKHMLSKPMLHSRVGKWSLVLTEFALRYVSMKAVKGQVLADFIVDHKIKEIKILSKFETLYVGQNHG